MRQGANQDALALAMAKAVARRAVLDWEGVGDAMSQPLPVTPEGIDALLEIWPVFEAFRTMQVAKGHRGRPHWRWPDPSQQLDDLSPA